MPIFKRGKTWWVAVSVPGTERIRCSAGTTDRKLAQEYHDKLKADLWRQVKLGERPVRYWEEAAVRWIREGQHKRSLHLDLGKIAFFDQKLKGTRLDAITADLIYEIVDGGKESSKPGTKNRYYALIRSILRRAEREWGWIDRAPFIRAHKEENAVVRWISREELERLVSELPKHLKPVVRFAVATGMRMRNITHLEWRQVDLERRIVTLYKTKNGKIQVVPLNQMAYDVVLEQRGKHETRVFTYAGKPFDNANDLGFKEALKRAGIENFRFHDLRHTWASWMIQEGVAEGQLQELGGWKDRDMMRRYAHLAPTQLAEAATVIDRIMAQSKHSPVADGAVSP